MSNKSKKVIYEVQRKIGGEWMLIDKYGTPGEATARIKRRHASDILFGQPKTVARLVRITEEVVD